MTNHKPFMLALAVLLMLSMLAAASCGALDQLVGPQAAANATLKRWAEITGNPYRDATFETLTDDGTYATVRVIAYLRPSEASDWTESQAYIHCTKIGQDWQCDVSFGFSDGPTLVLERREAEWAYLLSGPGIGYYVPRTFAAYGKVEGIDINQRETWVNTRLAPRFESLNNFVQHLRNSDGRAELAAVIEKTADRENLPPMRRYAEILKDENWGARYPAEYANEEAVLRNFFGEGLGYSEMELAIFKGALALWKTGNSTIEFEGSTTTFKDLVNRYNAENAIDVNPLP